MVSRGVFYFFFFEHIYGNLLLSCLRLSAGVYVGLFTKYDSLINYKEWLLVWRSASFKYLTKKVSRHDIWQQEWENTGARLVCVE